MRIESRRVLLKSVCLATISTVALVPAAHARDWFPGNDSEVVDVAGIGDKTFASRVEPINGPRENSVVDYVGSMGPFSGGNRDDITQYGPFAPGYDESVAEGVDAVEKAFSDHAAQGENREPVIWAGYSQGSEVLGDGTERAVEKGYVGEEDRVLLLADPRSPWGIQATSTTPAGKVILGTVGLTPRGARNPAATGNTRVTEVVMTSDPTTNTQWDSRRPVESIAVDVAGQILVHGGASSTNYAYALDPSSLENAKFYKSEEGNTVYAVVETPHPFTLAQERVYDGLGIEYSDGDVDEWEQHWQGYYPISEPTPENAAVALRPATREEFEASLPPKSQQPTGVAPADRKPLESAKEPLLPPAQTGGLLAGGIFGRG